MEDMNILTEIVKTSIQSGLFSKENIEESRYIGSALLVACDATEKIAGLMHELEASEVPDISETAIEHRGSLIGFRKYLGLLLMDKSQEERQQIYDTLRFMQKDEHEKKVVLVSGSEQCTGKSSFVKILNDLGITAFEDYQVLKIELDRIIAPNEQCEVKVRKKIRS